MFLFDSQSFSSSFSDPQVFFLFRAPQQKLMSRRSLVRLLGFGNHKPPLFPRWEKLRIGHLLKVTAQSNDLFQKKSKQVTERLEDIDRFFWDIRERTCWNSRGQLKKKWNFQGYSWKTRGISIGLGFWPRNFHQQGISHRFAQFVGVKACLLRAKWQI